MVDAARHRSMGKGSPACDSGSEHKSNWSTSCPELHSATNLAVPRTTIKEAIESLDDEDEATVSGTNLAKVARDVPNIFLPEGNQQKQWQLCPTKATD